MMKISLFVCAIFISIQNGNSSPDQFGSFLGPCPAAPTNSRTRVSLNNIAEKWYTHRVLGQYSPWKYFECQTSDIVYTWKNRDNVTSRFSLPYVKLPIEWKGSVGAVSKNVGKFEFDYVYDGWFLTQNTVFLQYYPSGAALVWNCLDFWLFHIESIAVMTKYQDPNDQRINPLVFSNFNSTLKEARISPQWFESIEQQNCDQE